MADAFACPAVPDWQRFLLGQCSDAEVDQLGRHLGSCGRCIETVQTLKAEDTVVEALRKRGAAALESDDELLKGRIEQLCRLYRTTAEPSTGGERPTPPPEAAPGPEQYDFLAPPQGPNELGRLGGYRVLKVLGAGGMGVVFLAEDVQLQRPVALKAMRPALAATPAARERFLREARAVAALHHDHIITIYQVGEDRGVPFLAMEFLEGLTLHEWLGKGRRPTLGQLLRIGRETALGLAAAHEKGLIHRDIKPGNIWLEAAQQGRVKLLDFGLARAVTDETHLTRSGAVVGTPSYMAPEQARGQALDPRCDLFSLGCVLYQLATGVLPFQAENMMGMLLAVTTDAPKPPQQLTADLPAAVEELILKLLAKERTERPASARAVAQEIKQLERTLKVTGPLTVENVPGEPQPSGNAGRSRKRRWVAVAAGLLLLIGGVLLAPIVIRIKHPDGKETEIEVPEGSSVELRQGDKVLARVPAQPIQPKQPIVKTTEALNPYALVSRPVALPGVVGWTVQTRGYRGLAGYDTLAYSPGGHLLAMGSYDATVRLWDWKTGTLVRALVFPTPIQSLAWSPDGRKLAASGWGQIQVWDVATGREVQSLTEPGYGRSLAWSPDGKTLASTTDYGDRKLRLWDVATGQVKKAFPLDTGLSHALAWSPDGTTLADGGGNTLICWDVASGDKKRTLQFPEPLSRLAWSPNGQQLLTYTPKDGVRLWDVATAKSLQQWPGAWPAWAPDGKRLVMHRDQRLRIIEAETGKEEKTIPAPNVKFPVWSPDGQQIAALDPSGRVMLFDVPGGKLERSIASNTLPGRVGSWSPDGNRLLVGRANLLRLFDAASGRQVKTLKRQAAEKAVCVAWSADGKQFATGDSDRHIRIWDGAMLRLERDLANRSVVVRTLAWSPDGSQLAYTADDELVRIVKAAGPPQVATLKGHTGAVRSLAWSPDSTKLLTGSKDQTARVWDTASGQMLHKLEDPQLSEYSVAWSPDGRRLATTQRGGVVIWAAQTGERLRSLPLDWCRLVAWSPDSRQLLGGGNFEEVYIWDVDTGKRSLVLQGHTGTYGAVLAACWTADGQALRTFGTDGTIRRWATTDGRPLGMILLPDDDNWLALTPEGFWTGTPGAEAALVVIVRTKEGQETLTPAEFAKKYGWKNEPERVRLIP